MDLEGMNRAKQVRRRGARRACLDQRVVPATTGRVVLERRARLTQFVRPTAEFGRSGDPLREDPPEQRAVRWQDCDQRRHDLSHCVKTVRRARGQRLSLFKVALQGLKVGISGRKLRVLP